MGYTTTFKRGHIYWAKKSTDAPDGKHLYATGGKDRPAVIVSNDACNANSTVLEVVYLTTQPKKDLPTHVTIRSTEKISTALCEQITSIHVADLGDFIGACSPAEMEAIDIGLAISLGLSDVPYHPTQEPDEEPEDEEPQETTSELEAARDRIKELEETVEDQDRTIDDCDAEIQRLRAEMKSTAAEAEVVRKCLDGSRTENAKLTAERNLLRELYESAIERLVRIKDSQK